MSILLLLDYSGRYYHMGAWLTSIGFQSELGYVWVKLTHDLETNEQSQDDASKTPPVKLHDSQKHVGLLWHLLL